MKLRIVSVASLALAGLLGAGLVACSSTSESGGSDKLSDNVGNYDPGPQGVYKPRVGCPPWETEGAKGGPALDDKAADMMDTLLYKTKRFDVIERTQLDKMLKEQGLEGIVKPGELAKPGQVRGVDYLLIGKVTSLSVQKSNTGNSFGIGSIGGQFINVGGLAIDKKNTEIHTICGVDFRLVDPTTGTVWIANTSTYDKKNTADSMGLTLLGASTNSEANIDLSEDDKGRVLRLALDDCLRKAMDDIDDKLKHQAPRPADAPATPAPAPGK